MRKGLSFQQVVLGKLGVHMQKNKIGPLLNTAYKINLKYTKDLTVRPKTIKLLKKK